MKKCICSAIVIDGVKRANLCQCVEILGGYPIECGYEVSVVYAGENAKVIALLFEQYGGTHVWTTKGEKDV